MSSQLLPYGIVITTQQLLSIRLSIGVVSPSPEYEPASHAFLQLSLKQSAETASWQHPLTHLSASDRGGAAGLDILRSGSLSV